MRSKRLVGATAGAALALSGAAFAGGSNDELLEQIEVLQARVAQLETQNGEGWLTRERAEEVRGLVHDVLADADTRASLLQSEMTAGYQDGFHIGSADGNWLLKVNGHMQARFIYNNQDNGPADDNRWGFENTRTKLIFSGNVVDPAWTYKIETNFSRGETFSISSLSIANDEITSVTAGNSSASGFGLDDAWIRWDYGNGWGIKFGQFRLPLTRERLVYSGHQLAVERSDVGYLFSAGFGQGIMVEYDGDQVRGALAYSDGTGGSDSGFANTSWNTATTEFAVTGRAELLAMGNWDQFDDFTSPAGDETGLLVGLGGHYEVGESGTAADELEIGSFTVDAQAEFGGANLFGAFYYRTLEFKGGSSNADQFGLVIQGGYAFTDEWEGFARYEWGDPDTAGGDDINMVTFGVNRYFEGHKIKWTTDVVVGVDGVPALAGNSITGTRADTAGEDSQVALRTQLQLMF